MWKKKRSTRLLVAILLISIVFLNMEINVQAQDDRTQKKVLFLIDASGSLSKEEKAVNESLKVLCAWLKSSQAEYDFSFIKFAKEAEEIIVNPDALDDFSDISMSGNTCVSAGLDAANEWFTEHREGDEKVFIIVISDLISDPGKAGYTMEDAKAEQERIDAIISTWKEQSEENNLDFLFLTWKNQEDDIKELKKFSEDTEYISEFRCNISEGKNVQWLKVNNAAEEGEAVSKLELVGKMLKSIVQMVEGVTFSMPPKKYAKNGEELPLEEFCEAYFLLGGNDTLLSTDSEKTGPLLCETDTIKIYHIGTEMKGDTYNICTEETRSEYVYFYIPTPTFTVSFDKTIKMAGESFEISCDFFENSDYYREITGKEIEAVLYRSSDEEESGLYRLRLCMDENGIYKGTVCLKEADLYYLDVETCEGQALQKAVDSFMVSESKVGTETGNDLTDSEKEETGGNNFLVLLVLFCGVVIVILVLVVLGTTIYLKRR